MILQAHGLKKSFSQRYGVIKALDGVDLCLRKAAGTALVGESGCGKTTLARVITGLYPVEEGKIFFRDRDISDFKKGRPVLRKSIRIVFQNPYLSVDPRYKVFDVLYEAYTVSGRAGKKEARDVFNGLLEKVGLDSGLLARYPHQLSGGQLQRVCVARSLVNNPELIIFDEPTSALDITTTVAIVHLLRNLREEFSFTYLFISHNLKLVKQLASYLYVMYRGKIVEHGPLPAVFSGPVHPYTRLLLSAAYYRKETGKIPAPYNGRDPEEKCVFFHRCPEKTSACRRTPRLAELEPGHFAACFNARSFPGPKDRP